MNRYELVMRENDNDASELLKIERRNPIHIGEHVSIKGRAYLVFSICHYECGTQVYCDKI
jgi:hypothetical protein